MACSSAKCEECLAIDLAHLKRQGILRSGLPAPLSWSRGGELIGSVGVLSVADGLHIMYRTGHGDDGEDVAEHVPYVWTETRFGGRRAWFKCLGCRKRCRVLYGGSRFRCRHCHGLKYASQYEPQYQRATERADKIGRRVGGNAYDGEEFPPKPKGMHWKKYWRLEERYDELKFAWTVGLMGQFGLRGER